MAMAKQAEFEMDERMDDPVLVAWWKARHEHALDGGKAEREVADVLTRAVMARFKTGMHPRRGIEKLVRNFFGAGISTMSIRKDLMCNQQRLEEYKAVVYQAMMEIGERVKR